MHKALPVLGSEPHQRPVKPAHLVQQLWGLVHPSASRVSMENHCMIPDFLQHCLVPFGLQGREPALIIRVDFRQAKGLSEFSEASPSDFGTPGIHLILPDQHHCQGPLYGCRAGQAQEGRSQGEEAMRKGGSFLPVTGDLKAPAHSWSQSPQ